MPRIIPTKETIFLLKTIALVNDLSDFGGSFVFKSKNFLNIRLVFTSNIELIEILGVFRILSLVFVVNLSNEVISEFSSFFIHYSLPPSVKCHQGFCSSLFAHFSHLSLRVNILLKDISWWQREQFLLTNQKRMPSMRRVLRTVSRRINTLTSFFS
jgi:hypothetical protein